jgi:hypothetical protein
MVRASQGAVSGCVASALLMILGLVTSTLAKALAMRGTAEGSPGHSRSQIVFVRDR